MIVSIRKIVMALGVVAILASANTGSAMMLDGSLPLAGFVITQTGPNLATSSMIQSGFTLVTGPGMGSYTPVPLLTNFGPHTLNLTSVANLIANFSLSNATFGTFVPTSAQIIDRQTNFLDISFVGIFTPGAGLPGFDPTETILRISINQSNRSLSEAITLNSVPVPEPVPEPGTWVLMVTGALGLLGYHWRRQRQG